MRITDDELAKLSPDELWQCNVLQADGTGSTVGELLGSGPAIVVFLRHYGCIGCDENVATLAPVLTELAQLRVRSLLIGNGSVEQLQDFVQERKLEKGPVLVVTDPDRVAYQAMGLPRSFVRTFVSGAAAIWKGTLKGFRQTTFRGDSQQQGGTLICNGEGKPQYFYRNKDLADFAPVDEVYQVALEMVAKANLREIGI